jgi:hypothetical protein
MNRKLLVRGIALLLFAMVAVSAFAAFGWKDGVRYEDVELSGERYLQLYNGNDYTVRVYLDNAIGRGYGHTWVDLKPEELYNAFKTNGANGIIKSVVKM